ncbi:MAG: hypothetical protein PVSMB4_03810 [Ktedonobacterales bacterium]
MALSREMGTLRNVDTSHSTVRFVVTGSIAGMIAGVVMAMYAMLASATVLGQGFFTPLYGIASPLIGPGAMMASMKAGLYFSVGPALLGLMVHMLWSSMYGVVFGFLARALHFAGVGAVIAGIGYGVVVLLVMSLVVLPLVGVGAMTSVIGWPSFTIEHVVFGLVLGLWPVVRPRDFVVRHTSGASAQQR